jgi:rhomboid family GlyGly-CTERM serine protease
LPRADKFSNTKLLFEVTEYYAFYKGKRVNRRLMLPVNLINDALKGIIQLFKLTYQQYLPYAVALLISTLLYLWYGFFSDVNVSDSLLAFHRDQAAHGKWWQWISAHFMHNNFIHYLVNMIGLVLLCLLHSEYASVKSFSINFIVMSLGISLCIYVFSPSLISYVGMSGVLHGLFAWGVVIDIHLKRKTGYLLFVGLVIKLVDEQFFASSNFMAALIEVRIAIDAHLYGAMIGLLLGVMSIVLRSPNVVKYKH